MTMSRKTSPVTAAASPTTTSVQTTRQPQHPAGGHTHGTKCACTKRPKRFHWTSELHITFLKVLRKLGRRATPARILKELYIPGLTREQVSSHLQRVKSKDRSFLSIEPLELTFQDETSKVISSTLGGYNVPSSSKSSLSSSSSTQTSSQDTPSSNDSPQCADIKPVLSKLGLPKIAIDDVDTEDETDEEVDEEAEAFKLPVSQPPLILQYQPHYLPFSQQQQHTMCQQMHQQRSYLEPPISFAGSGLPSVDRSMYFLPPFDFHSEDFIQSMKDLVEVVISRQ
eukprot:TRINITY_DN247_c0_g1_i1.p1 TRINITY_DN247_c0_g1~~TRINITY_DN247_c0_g1_i1.p1  ORF type:complete len:283 (-),score=34.47 TRINITY_DN247_c0_g1_i1:78-926(-)